MLAHDRYPSCKLSLRSQKCQPENFSACVFVGAGGVTGVDGRSCHDEVSCALFLAGFIGEAHEVDGRFSGALVCGRNGQQKQPRAGNRPRTRASECPSSSEVFSLGVAGVNAFRMRGVPLFAPSGAHDRLLVCGWAL